jgi:hypothetical protein
MKEMRERAKEMHGGELAVVAGVVVAVHELDEAPQRRQWQARPPQPYKREIVGGRACEGEWSA